MRCRIGRVLGEPTPHFVGLDVDNETISGGCAAGVDATTGSGAEHETPELDLVVGRRGEWSQVPQRGWMRRAFQAQRLSGTDQMCSA